MNVQSRITDVSNKDEKQIGQLQKHKKNLIKLTITHPQQVVFACIKERLL